MDPNEALANMRRLVAEAIDTQERADNSPAPAHKRPLPIPLSKAELLSAMSELANQFHTLDSWLTAGGFKPSDWE